MRYPQSENIFLQLDLTLLLARNVFDPLLRIFFRPLVFSRIPERTSGLVVFAHIKV